MNTSRKQPHRSLVKPEMSARRMENLLADWINATTTAEQTSRTNADQARLKTKYPEVFPIESKTLGWFLMRDVQTFLRLAWDASDVRRREWFIFCARQVYHDATAIHPLRCKWELLSDPSTKEHRDAWREWDEAVHAAPALTLFEQIAWHFHRIADRARHCANPECPAPYFFALKKGQKYCSSKCSAPSQRDQKRRWWRENRAKNGETQ